MRKIVIVGNFAFTLAPNPYEDNAPWLYFQPVDNHNRINVAVGGGYDWRVEEGGWWEEVDPRMGYDIDKIKELLNV